MGLSVSVIPGADVRIRIRSRVVRIRVRKPGIRAVVRITAEQNARRQTTQFVLFKVVRVPEALIVTFRGKALRFLISRSTYFISVELVKNFSTCPALSGLLSGCFIFTKKRSAPNLVLTPSMKSSTKKERLINFCCVVSWQLKCLLFSSCGIFRKARVPSSCAGFVWVSIFLFFIDPNRRINGTRRLGRVIVFL